MTDFDPAALEIDFLRLRPPGGFRVIYADPPWPFDVRGENGHEKSPERHYRTMQMRDIIEMPVSLLAAEDCLLFIWTTWPRLPDGIRTLRGWGFDYSTGGIWNKLTQKGGLAFGTGYVFRSACEPYLIGRRGQPTVADRSIRNVIDAPVREHSRKPDEARERLDALFPGAAKIELFARTSAPGWTVWGNETHKFREG